MTSFEKREEAGLEIIWNALDPALAHDFGEECQALFDPAIELGVFSNTQATESPSSVLTVDCGSVSTLRNSKYRLIAIPEVLDIIGITAEYQFAINEQGPHAKQVFHPDIEKQPPVVVIHPHGQGALDYVDRICHQEQAEKIHQTLELNAGDIVFQSRPYLMHRGRNTGAQKRLTAVLYLPR